MTQASQTPGLCFGTSNTYLIPKSAEEAVEKHEKPAPVLQNRLDIYVYHMSDVPCSPYTVQAVRPNVPLVALSPCVSVVPSAHGFVTGEASGLGRTALPYRRLSSCSTRAWTVFVGCTLSAASRRLWLRSRT